MFDTDYERPRGVLVYPMTDFPEVNGPVIAGRYALMVRWIDGEIDASEVRMVHTEGVAYLVTDEKPWCWTDYDTEGSFEHFTPTELVHYANAVAGVDLADWIRTFGSRLESNFSQCYAWATAS